MANYESVTRSNYFHVKDEDAFSKFMDTVSDRWQSFMESV